MFHLNTLEQGGAERVVTNLANEFVKGEDTVIVATEWYGEDEFTLDERVKRLHVGLRGEDKNKGRFLKAYLRLKYLREAIKKENPDVVIAFAQKAVYRLCFAANGLKTPVIVCVRTDPVSHYDRFSDRIILPLINRRPDGAVFQTTGQRDFFSKRWQDISTIILNPVNEKYFVSKDKAGGNPEAKVIVQHARLVDFKNQPMLIDAFMSVHEKYPDYELKIYGPDSFDGTKQILEEKIKQVNGESFIHLMGGSDELEKLVPKASIYAFSSDWEGLPNTLMEAMAMGMPIVATDCPCGGPDTIMEKDDDSRILADQRIKATKDGILVPIKDASAMASGLIYMIENPQFALECARHATGIYEKTNPEAVTKAWRDYIEKVICFTNKRKMV